MAEAVIQDCRTRELPEVDSMVVAGSVVEMQLYDLVAEEMAIEDTIYVLGKALDRERITLEVFLKVSFFFLGRRERMADASRDSMRGPWLENSS